MKYVIGRRLHMIPKWELKWYLPPGEGVTDNINEAYHYDKQTALNSVSTTISNAGIICTIYTLEEAIYLDKVLKKSNILKLLNHSAE